jgi:2',3'-cyclic-nucleotide 2'-phosphodiesterase (5'-nucleotidase family)
VVRKFYIIYILTIAFGACRDSTEPVSYAMKKDTLGIDSSIYKTIAPYKLKLDAQMNEVIAVSDTDMAKEKNVPESLLGNFISDLYKQIADRLYKPEDGKAVDFVMSNQGGLRTSLPKGNITTRNIFELLPFDNRLVVVTLSGDSAQSLFNYIAKKGGDPVSGLKMGIQDKKPLRPVIQGNSFDINKTYKVLTNDYCAAGGDQCWFFTAALKYEDLNVILRDIVVSELKAIYAKGQHITAKLDQRIYNAK